MAEDAKKSAPDSVKGTDQKGRAEHKPQTESTEKQKKDSSNKSKKATTKAETHDSDDSVVVEKDGVKVKATPSSDGETDKIELDIEITKPEGSEFQAEVREQIENCKFEIISSIQEQVHNEMRESVAQQVRRVERRRRAGFIIRDIVILLLAIIVGYFSYCLYDAEYFDFLKHDCSNNCESNSNNGDTANITEPEVIKDTNWYMQNYGDLFTSLRINLDADKVSAYYLYSDDLKVSEMQPEYLLAMAYNRLEPNVTIENGNIVIPADNLRNAFINQYGSADYFTKRSFTYGCVDFSFNKEDDTFSAPNLTCTDTSRRHIIEQVDEVYEEGNAIYFLTTATIYDKTEQSFYTFDNLFKPAVTNVEEADLSKHTALLNHYQYRFKKIDNQYHFSDIIKLK